MEQGMQALQGSNLIPNLPGMPPTPPGGNAGTTPNNMDFSQLLTQLQNTSMSSPPASSIPPEERYRVALQSLNDMGFTNRDQNLRILQQCHGNVNRAVELILAEPPQPATQQPEQSGGSTSNNDEDQET